MTKLVVAGPLGEVDLSYQNRLDPMAAFHDGRGIQEEQIKGVIPKRTVNSVGRWVFVSWGLPPWRKNYSTFPFNPLDTPWDKISLAANASKPRRE